MNQYDTDWCNLSEVKELCNSYGIGFIVYKRPNRANFNICHVSSILRLGIDQVWIVHRT